MGFQIAERLRCAWCGAWWHDGARLRWIESERVVGCREGSGCARRPAEHERQHGKRVQYLLNGYWYLASELAALAEICPATMRQRLHNGWPVASAVREPLDHGGPRGRWAQLQSLLRAMRSRSRIATWRTTDGRTLTAIAAEIGVSASALSARAKRRTLAEAIAMGGAMAGRTTNPSGRPTALGRSLDEIAQELGVSRQALWKAARRNGRTIAEEVALRTAANDTREVAA